jgi:carbamoyl-phosphate synthase large subunit
MSINVLVTSAGSIPGVAVIQALKKQEEIPVRVIAADMNPLSAGFCLSDSCITIPHASLPGFIPCVVDLCTRESIKVVFPIIDEELQVFADHSCDFEKIGVTLVTNAPDVVRTAKDKYETYLFCKSNGIVTPETFLPDEPRKMLSPKFPLIVKPRMGRGSTSVFKIENSKQLNFFCEYVADPIVQEFIGGAEYTIDILTTFDGEVLTVVPRERIETKAGMSVKGRTVKDGRLIEYGKWIAETVRLFPRGNIQCIDDGKDIYLIEINPKFAATLPFTVRAGVNMPLLLLKICLGGQIHRRIDDFEDDLVMLRYWQEVYIQDGGHPGGRMPPGGQL